MGILDNLNAEQRKPAETTEGAVLVTAGAGSGKTRLLTHRIAHIVCDLHVDPKNVLSITFTNKAAGEMKERLSKMIDATDMWISTFHSMCCKILRINATRIGYGANFTIYGDTEQDRLIKRLIAERGYEITAQSTAWHIGQAKNKLIEPEAYKKLMLATKNIEQIVDIFSAYNYELKQNNAMDFDDLLNKTLELFETCPDVLEKYATKFKYIHVDEFQDTNTAQYKIVKLLASVHGNIFVVGDEDQCIYTWRGAEVTNVRDFEKDFNDVKIFKLEQNYRSTKAILERANTLISKNKNRFDKKLWTENELGSNITEFNAFSDIEEAEYVASTIKRLTDEEGYQYKDIAVLMRVNSLSRLIEEKMLGYGISHQIYGGFKFFERKEVKDTLAYLRVLSNPKDNDAFIRIMAFPKKGIGEKTAQDLLVVARDNELSMYETLIQGQNLNDTLSRKFAGLKTLLTELHEDSEMMDFPEFITHLVKKVGIKEAIGSKTEEDISKQMNVDDLCLSVSQFCEQNDGATMDDYLQSVTLMRDIDNMEESDNNVTIMTVHSAKGLEFKIVFVIGLTDGLFPLQRAITSPNPEDLEEERRLMYVAITRAEKRLFLTRSKTRFVFETHRTELVPESRFFKEMRADANNEDDEEIVIKKPYENSYSQKKQTYHEKQVDVNMFQKGDRVLHTHFGEGTVTIPVTDPVGAFITVKFDGFGIKTLSLKFAPLTKL